MGITSLCPVIHPACRSIWNRKYPKEVKIRPTITKTTCNMRSRFKASSVFGKILTFANKARPRTDTVNPFPIRSEILPESAHHDGWLQSYTRERTRKTHQG